MLSERGLRPSRALGQNFVVDPNTVRRIAKLAEVGRESKVVEVGAGLGSLTLALSETGAWVTALEIDSDLVPILDSLVDHERVRVVEGDALTIDWHELLESSEGAAGKTEPWKLVGNLPYNVAVPLVARVLDEVPEVRRLVVMVQREVGERMAAKPGDSAYGSVSVKVAYHATAKVLGRVSAAVFMPRPNVESVIVGIDRLAAPAVDPGEVGFDRLFKVVRAGFAHRRKMLRRSLLGVVEVEAFEAAGIDPTARAEDLDVVAWGRLARWGEK
jgi:16S rRNA (adenine1518-N6/adenine1519-N6)-dimethyltransferase